MSRALAAERFLYTALSRDPDLAALSGGRIYAYLADRDAALPCVVYSFIASNDERTLGSTRSRIVATYAVKAIGEGADFTAIEGLYEALDAALQGGRQAADADQDPILVERVSTIQYLETDDGRHYSHLGGTYRLIVQPQS